MKVLLISANTETINMPVLPLGMAFVARAAEDAGHEVSQINLMAEPDALKTLAERIRAMQPDIIGISVRNIDDQAALQPRFLLDPVKAIISTCRQNSEAKIVLGGAGYSIYPQHTLAYLGADLGIQGEGENAFVALLDRLATGHDLSDIPGLHYPGRNIANPPSAFDRIEQIPFPKPGKHIFAIAPAKDEVIWIPFQTRRGCPFSCSYCSTPAIEGKITRKRPPEQVIEALASFVAAGFDHFFFVDNTFNLPVGYAKTLCDRIYDAGLKIAWRGIFYPWKVDPALAAKMARSGCVEMSIGIESGSDAMLKKMKKHFGTVDVRRSCDLLKANGIRRMGFLLLGGPGETRQTVLESLAFVDSLGLEMAKVTSGIRIYPNTELARYARETGKISAEDNLLFPTFYLEDGLEEWLRSTVDAWAKDRPNWIR
jgi:radical SAM superfamily enzyme YgiQ (UPF0313 family)